MESYYLLKETERMHKIESINVGIIVPIQFEVLMDYLYAFVLNITLVISVIAYWQRSWIKSLIFIKAVIFVYQPSLGWWNNSYVFLKDWIASVFPYWNLLIAVNLYISITCQHVESQIEAEGKSMSHQWTAIKILVPANKLPIKFLIFELILLLTIQ